MDHLYYGDMYEVGPKLGGGFELNPTYFKIYYDLCV